MTSSILEPYGVTIFCDDIREEVGGKFTYVGVYSSELRIVGEAPVKLPKFCTSVRLLIPTDANIRNVKMIVTLVDSDEAKPLLENDLEITYPERGTGDHLLVISHHVFSPLEIKRPCRIIVRALIDDATIRLGTLAIDFLSQKDTIDGSATEKY